MPPSDHEPLGKTQRQDQFRRRALQRVVDTRPPIEDAAADEQAMEKHRGRRDDDPAADSIDAPE